MRISVARGFRYMYIKSEGRIKKKCNLERKRRKILSRVHIHIYIHKLLNDSREFIILIEIAN